MAAPIARVRMLIGDPSGADQAFSDADIEAVLNEYELALDDYDVYGAAAELLEAWSAREKLAFDFSADGASYYRSQKSKALLEQAKAYRAKARPLAALLVRGDV